jgi:hypothetical protein
MNNCSTVHKYSNNYIHRTKGVKLFNTVTGCSVLGAGYWLLVVGAGWAPLGVRGVGWKFA